MFLAGKFENIVSGDSDKVILKRSGVASEVIIPKELFNGNGYDASIEGNAVVFEEGESVYVLTDSYGVQKNSSLEANIFLVEGGAIFEILGGEIVLQASNGAYFTVDAYGEIEYPDFGGDLPEFRGVEYLEEVLPFHIVNHYGADKEDALEYVHNLMFSIVFTAEGGTQKAGACYSHRVYSVYEDLGIDFEFKNFKDGSQDFMLEMDTEEEETYEVPDDEEEEDEFGMNMDDEEEEAVV